MFSPGTLHDVTHVYIFGERSLMDFVPVLKQHLMFIRGPFQHFHLENASSAACFEQLFQSLPPHEIYYHLIIYWATNHLQNLYGDLILPRSVENQVHAAVWWKADVQKERKKVSCKDDKETVWQKLCAPLTAVSDIHASEVSLHAWARRSDRLQERLIKV